MNRNKLNPWQARKMIEKLQPALGYLSRMQRRMELTGFPPNDRLYVATVQARNSLQSLLVDLHYLSCEGGVG